MASATTNPSLEADPSPGVVVPICPPGRSPSNAADVQHKPLQYNTLQALLAFSALREQVRQASESRQPQEPEEVAVATGKLNQFTLDEALHLVAQRAVEITGADGIAIALAENCEVVLLAAAGTVRPDLGAPIDRNSAFSGACFRNAETVTCDDTEEDERVNLPACRLMGVRSMVAVPLCLKTQAIGVLQAFSARPGGFDENDISALRELGELVLAVLTPDEERRLLESAKAASRKLEVSLDPETDEQTQAALALARQLLEDDASTADEATRTETSAPLPAAAPALVGTSSELQPAVRLVASAEPHRRFAVPTQAASIKSETTPGVSRRAGMLVLLVCTVIVTALAGAVWWKLRTWPPGNTIVRAERVAEPTVFAGKDSSSALAVGTVANPLDINSDSKAKQSLHSPAKPRDPSQIPAVTGIQHSSSADSSTVVISLDDSVQYEAHRLANPDRIYFDLHNTQLAPNIPSKPIEVADALLTRIRVAQPVTGISRVVLETTANADFSVSLLPDPYRLVVEVRKVGIIHKGAVNRLTNGNQPEKNNLPILMTPPTKEDLQLQQRIHKMRIVVDAGHGGRDGGTVGRDGLLEKDLVLEIGQRLGRLLKDRLGMDVIYTRQNDRYIPLDERVSITNQAQADLFVSVHANYSDLPSARGVETYYTQFFMLPTSKDADVPPAAELASTAATPSLSPADLQERAQQSRRLAESVQHSLYGILASQNPGLRDRGIKEANFQVLTESTMPGILAEVSFVSSPTDEQKLRSNAYREQVAEALYKGIARYAATFHGISVASAR
jgi:N-acetylmuramoyl-L-alanine amidase